MKTPPDESSLTKRGVSPSEPGCGCNSDPFASLPPELQPRKKSWKSGLHQVTCQGCGLEYWTNCEGLLCSDCKKKGIRIPEENREK